MFISISGTVTDEKETSVRAKCLRKKYMGVWKQESSLMSRGWACSPAPWSGTCPGTGQRTHPAALEGWGAPGEGTRTHCCGSPSSCHSYLCWEWIETGNVRNLDILSIATTIWSHTFSKSLCHCTDKFTALHSHVGTSSSLVRTVKCDLSEHWHSHLETSFKHQWKKHQSNSSAEIRKTSFFF